MVDKNDGSEGLKFNTSHLMQTTEEVARAFIAAASAATVQSTRPSVVYSSREESGSPMQKLQQQFSKILKGFSTSPEVSGSYNPEVLTTQKRQWSRFQLKSLGNRCIREPSHLFESIVIVGLPPQADIHELENIALGSNEEDVKKPRNIFGNNHHQVHALSNLEPQVLFAYPPERPLPLKYKDILSFCLPGGVQVHAVERTPSFSELNEILLGQEQLKESNQSFVFRLQSFALPPFRSALSRSGSLILVYHFILMEERLEWLTDGVSLLTSLSPEETCEDDVVCEGTELTTDKQYFDGHAVDLEKSSESSLGVCSKELFDTDSSSECRDNHLDLNCKEVQQECVIQDDLVTGTVPQCDTLERPDNCLSEDTTADQSGIELHELDSVPVILNESDTTKNCGYSLQDDVNDEQLDVFVNDTIIPLMRSRLCEGSESSPSSQDSPSEGINFRSDTHESDLEEPSSIGHGDLVGHNNISQWAKAKKYGSLQVVSQYYQLQCPARGSSLTFHPLDHLHPLRFHRPGETVLHIAGSTIDLRSSDTSLEVAEMRNALFAEEESTALSAWAVASICGCLRLEHVMTLFAAALLEKQIVIVCSNLGMLSASVLSIIPLIRPYQWQSLLIPVLPNDMTDFLDAPVPYIVGVQNKTSDLHSRLANAVVIDANKNQIKSTSVPQLPQQKELLSALRPYHSRLVGESFLARKRPVYECTDAQVEAAKGFLAVLRSYLDSLCSNLRSHTITNVQSNNDKVSLLLRESFIGSFPTRERPFMKVIVEISGPNCISETLLIPKMPCSFHGLYTGPWTNSWAHGAVWSWRCKEMVKAACCGLSVLMRRHSLPWWLDVSGGVKAGKKHGVLCGRVAGGLAPSTRRHWPSKSATDLVLAVSASAGS
uniref:UDENN domain-containing protein n=1 Tax=Oryza punctata TaxID=4537 RepID=A0A0E0K5W1_ORYPU